MLAASVALLFSGRASRRFALRFFFFFMFVFVVFNMDPFVSRTEEMARLR